MEGQVPTCKGASGKKARKGTHSHIRGTGPSGKALF